MFLSSGEANHGAAELNSPAGLQTSRWKFDGPNPPAGGGRSRFLPVYVRLNSPVLLLYT